MLKTFNQFLTFSFVGIFGTGGHYLTLILLVEWFNISPAAATTAGFAVGALINYFLNYYFTFKSNKPHREALYKFLIVAILGAFINTTIMYYGEHITDFHYLVIQVIATILVLIFNFSANKIWTFAHKQTTS